MIAGFIGQNLQGSIDRKSCRFNFFAETSIKPKPIWYVGLSVYFKYNRKNPSYVLEVFEELCVESFVRFERCLPSYIHTHKVVKIKIRFKNLMISSVAV